MSEFVCSIDKKIHYEIKGEGQPLVMLNGIMMSTLSWAPFVSNLSSMCKVILVDLLDMGSSDSMSDRPQYEQSLQADVLAELVTHLGLKSVSVMGISYGGEVALQYAIKYPEKLNKLLLFNTAPYTSKWLWDIGLGWNITGETLNGQAYYDVTIPYFYSLRFYDRKNDWMENRKATLNKVFSNPDFQDRMKRLVLSTERYDVRDKLSGIKARTLVVGSRFDNIIPLHEQEYIHSHIAGSSMAILPESGHCSMFEDPDLFVSLITGFVNLKDVIQY